MKHLLPSLIFLASLAQPACAQQPKWAKNARKAVVTLRAVQTAGDTLSARAFFLSPDGTLLTALKPLQAADRAWVEDEKGQQWPVARICGMNATYNVAKLRVAVDPKKKLAFLPIAASQSLTGDIVYSYPFAAPDTIAQQEKADAHNYYTLTSAATPELEGAPVMNQQGEAVAILQVPLTVPKAPNYALSTSMADELQLKGWEVNSKALAACRIPRLLPADENEASTFLYLAAACDSLVYATCIEDYIQAYPQSSEGYCRKAELLAANEHFEQANQVYEDFLKDHADQSDALLYARAILIYKYCSMTQYEGKLPASWTLEQSLADAARAVEQNPATSYRAHQASVLYALKRYDEACAIYTAIAQQERSADLFAYACMCKDAAGAPKGEQLALADSAVACFTKPYSAGAANYLYLRANIKRDMGKPRDAVADLNEYEHLMQGRLTAKFYYERMQLELQTRMYAPALSDIERAVSLEPREPIFHAELAALLFRVSEYDKAIEACQQTLALDPTFPDAHRIWGICLREKGDLPAAREHLQQAKDLGDEVAAKLLEDSGKQE